MTDILALIQRVEKLEAENKKLKAVARAAKIVSEKTDLKNSAYAQLIHAVSGMEKTLTEVKDILEDKDE